MAGTLEANKIIAGVLTAGVIFVGASVLSDLLYHPTQLAEPAYPVITEDATEMAEAEPEPQIEPLPVRLAAASAADGEGAFRACAACHSVEEGGANMVGPNLWNVMGAEIAAHEGFNYSDALAGKDGEWTWAKMDAWLENPNDWAPGTSMSYAGISDPQDRADMLAYLRTLATEPEPLPEPEAAEPEDDAAAAEGTGETEAAAADTGGGDAAPADAETAAEASADDAAGEASATDAADAASDAAGSDAASDAADSDAAGTGEATEMAAATDTGADTAVGDGGGNALVQRVAAASVADGEGAFRACSACHTAEQGRPHRVGPNLWDIVGADIAGKDFGYSDVLAGKEGTWTLAKLDAWLENPMAWAEGTTMAYAGIQDPDQRAAVIAYLRSLAEDPVPLETVAGETPAQGG
jgi:cytochrome c2